MTIKPNELNDSLDDLLSGPVATTPRTANKEGFVPAEQRAHTENCPKCGGTGRWGNYVSRPCFKCGGSGKLTFKTSYADRAKAKASRDQRKAARSVELADSNVEAFKAAHPEQWAWLQANAARNGFAQSLTDGIKKFGTLTTGQSTALDRAVAQAAKAKAEAPTVATDGVDRLKQAFDKAVAYTAAKGLKLSPRITISGITISPAKADGKNPGALYVKAGASYLGKIAGGKFFASRECSDDQSAQVLKFVADPAEAAKVYGQTTGTCCICGATLRSEWKHRGVGPICGAKFGW
jgi:hypothetical protein